MAGNSRSLMDGQAYNDSCSCCMNERIVFMVTRLFSFIRVSFIILLFDTVNSLAIMIARSTSAFFTTYP